MGEAVERFLIRTQTQLLELQPADTGQPAEVGASPPLSSYSAAPAQQGRTQARLLRKWKLSQRVKELHAEGMSLRRIGEEMGLARNSVRKYFREPPEAPKPTPRAFRTSLLDPSDDYLLERLSQGCRATVSRNQGKRMYRKFEYHQSLCEGFTIFHSRGKSATNPHAASGGHLASGMTLAADAQA